MVTHQPGPRHIHKPVQAWGIHADDRDQGAVDTRCESDVDRTGRDRDSPAGDQFASFTGGGQLFDLGIEGALPACPSSQSPAVAEWVAPIKPEKCGLGGNSTRCAASLQVAANVSRYRADSSGTAVGSTVGVAAVVAVGTYGGAIATAGSTVAGGAVGVPAAGRTHSRPQQEPAIVWLFVEPQAFRPFQLPTNWHLRE